MPKLKMQVIAGRLKEARQSAGLSQAQVGNRAGLDRDKVAAIEAGRREIGADEIYPLAQSVGRRVLDLLGVEEATTHRSRNLARGADYSEVENFAKTFLRREAALSRLLNDA